jgi:hypothetical protein
MTLSVVLLSHCFHNSVSLQTSLPVPFLDWMGGRKHKLHFSANLRLLPRCNYSTLSSLIGVKFYFSSCSHVGTHLSFIS